MQLQLSGQHLEITEAMRAYTEAKLERFTRLDERLTSLTVVLTIDNHQNLAEGTLHGPGTRLHAEATEADMYTSIDVMVEKLITQLRKHREKSADKHQHEKRQERHYG